MVKNFFTLLGQTKEVVKAGGEVMKDATACEAEPKASTSAELDLETAKDASKHAPKVHKWCLKEISSKNLDLKISQNTKCGLISTLIDLQPPAFL